MGHEVPAKRGVYGHVTPAIRGVLTPRCKSAGSFTPREVTLSARSIVPALDALLTDYREPPAKIGPLSSSGSYFAPKIGHQGALRLAERNTNGQ